MYGRTTTVAEWRPDIRMLLTLQILDSDQVRILMSKRRLFYEKLQAHEHIAIAEYQQMIKDEIYVLDLCKYQYHNDMVPMRLLTFFNAKVLKVICNKIDMLYYNMLLQFPIDAILLESYIDFSKNCAEHKNKVTCHRVLTQAIETDKNNLDIWIKVIEFYVSQDCYENANQIFQDGVKLFGNTSLALWDEMYKYFQKNDHNIDLLKEFYIQGAYQPYEEINLKYRVEYLNWFRIRQKSLPNMRKLFRKLRSIHPQCKELYSIMIDYENSKETPSLESVRKLHNTLCKEFGHSDVQIWINWMSFEFKHSGHFEAQNVYHDSSNFLTTEEMNVLFLKLNEMNNNPNLIVKPNIIISDGDIITIEDSDDPDDLNDLDNNTIIIEDCDDPNSSDLNNEIEHATHDGLDIIDLVNEPDVIDMEDELDGTDMEDDEPDITYREDELYVSDMEVELVDVSDIEDGSDMEDDVSDMEDDVSDMGDDVSDMEDDVSDMGDDVSDMEDVSDIEDYVSDMEDGSDMDEGASVIDSDNNSNISSFDDNSNVTDSDVDLNECDLDNEENI